MRALISLINHWHLLFYLKCVGWDVEEALEETFDKLSKHKVKGAER